MEWSHNHRKQQHAPLEVLFTASQVLLVSWLSWHHEPAPQKPSPAQIWPEILTLLLSQLYFSADCWFLPRAATPAGQAFSLPPCQPLCWGRYHQVNHCVLSRLPLIFLINTCYFLKRSCFWLQLSLQLEQLIYSCTAWVAEINEARRDKM